MTLPLPTLDAHAHIAPAVPAADLASLDAAVFAVTRTPGEWRAVADRTDKLTSWGLGCHPALSDAVETFSPAEFSTALQSAAFVGEVGLDGRSGSDGPRQRQVFDHVLEMVACEPRAVSIHSRGATSQVLDALERHPQPGAILHWWRGSRRATERAIEMGSFFSLNGAEAASPRVLELLPAEHVLTETDFPHTRKRDPAGERPGRTQTIERALQDAWALDVWGVRSQIWRNLGRLLEQTGSLARMPSGIKKALLIVDHQASQHSGH